MDIEVKVSGTTPSEVLAKLTAAVSVWSSVTQPVGVRADDEEAPAKRTRKAKTKAALTDDDDLLSTDANDEELSATGDEDAGEDSDLDFNSEFANDDDVEVADEPPPKAKAKAKTPKLTEKDVNTACMAHAKANGRPKTLALLAKKFKVKSIQELKADQYAKVIEALNADT